MSIFNYLQLQPVDPKDDGSISDLDAFEQDEKFDLSEGIDEKKLEAFWQAAVEDLETDPKKITFSEE